MATSSPSDLHFSSQSENESNLTHGPDLEEWWDVVYCIVSPYIDTVCGAGVLRNVCGVSVCYLINLAAADMVFLVHLPFWTDTIRNKYNWPFGTSFVIAPNTSIKINTYTSNFVSDNQHVLLFSFRLHPEKQRETK